MGHKTHQPHLSDVNQSWLDLVVIQFSGWMGIPTLASSILILQQNSFLGSIFTIIVGNAIMWFIRLGIISMSYANRQSTLDISKTFLGIAGGYVVAVLLLLSTFAWYVVQTSIGSDVLTHLLSIHENSEINQFSQISVLLGLLSSLLCMEGMGLLRKLSMICFPILIGSFFVIFFLSPAWDFQTENQKITLAGLSIFLATNLGISSDLPTFFRHSKTWETAVKALTAVQIINLLFGILGLYLGKIVVNGFEINEQYILASGTPLLKYSLIIFVFVSVICANVANVYSSSVGWELIAPKALIGRKEYLVLGLSLSIIFILLSNVLSMDFLLTITDNMLVNLSIVLCIGYLMQKKYASVLDPSMQKTYFLSWALASTLNVIQYIYNMLIDQLLCSLLVISVSIFVCTIFKKFVSCNKQ